MGCGSSGMKVEPSTSNENSPRRSGDGKTNSQNGDTKLRGDRLSMMDARQRRENDNKEHRRKLSTLQTNQVKLSRNSSRASSKRGSMTPDYKDDEAKILSTHHENYDSKPKQNGGLHHKMTDNVVLVHSGESDNVGDIDDEPMKISKYTQSNSPNDSLEGRLTADNSPRRANYIIHDTTNTDTAKHKTERERGKESRTESPSNARLIFVESANPRQSVDSTKLKNNANDLVNNILSNAVFQIKKDESADIVPLSSHSSSTKTSSFNGSSATRTDVEQPQAKGVESQAKNIVDDAIRNALLKVNKDHS